MPTMYNTTKFKQVRRREHNCKEEVINFSFLFSKTLTIASFCLFAYLAVAFVPIPLFDLSFEYRNLVKVFYIIGLRVPKLSTTGNKRISSTCVCFYI